MKKDVWDTILGNADNFTEVERLLVADTQRGRVTLFVRHIVGRRLPITLQVAAEGPYFTLVEAVVGLQHKREELVRAIRDAKLHAMLLAPESLAASA